MKYLLISLGTVATFCLAYVAFALCARVFASAFNEASGSADDLDFLRSLIVAIAPCNEIASFDLLRSSVERKLMLADLSGEYTPAEFLAFIEICSVGFAIFLFGLFAISGNLGFGSVLAVAVAAGVGFWLGLEWLNNLVSERRKELSLTFPYFLDLSVMTMEAGSSILETMEIYIRDNPPGPLTEELGAVLSEVKMGSTFEMAMLNFEKKILADDVQATIRAILQGQRMGTPLGAVIREQAETIRFKRGQRAERAAEEIKVKMQGPAMLLMVSVLLLILGPALIGMFDSGVF